MPEFTKSFSSVPRDDNHTPIPVTHVITSDGLVMPAVGVAFDSVRGILLTGSRPPNNYNTQSFNLAAGVTQLVTFGATIVSMLVENRGPSAIDLIIQSLSNAARSLLNGDVYNVDIAASQAYLVAPGGTATVIVDWTYYS